MCPPNDHSLHDSASEIAELLAAPPLSLAELLEDPEVRFRIGFSISRATARPRRGKQKRHSDGADRSDLDRWSPPLTRGRTTTR
jgi:hypothetical protein